MARVASNDTAVPPDAFEVPAARAATGVRFELRPRPQRGSAAGSKIGDSSARGQNFWKSLSLAVIEFRNVANMHPKEDRPPSSVI